MPLLQQPTLEEVIVMPTLQFKPCSTDRVFIEMVPSVYPPRRNPATMSSQLEVSSSA